MMLLSRPGGIRGGLALVLVLVLAGCGSDASSASRTGSGSSTGSVSAADLERQVERRLSKQVGVEIDATCDAGIRAKRGAKEYCSGVGEGQEGLEQRIRVRVEGVEDGRAQLDVTIFKQIESANAARSAQQQLAAAGEPAARVSCPDENVPLEADTSFSCEITGSKQGDTITFSIREDNEPAAVKAKIT